MTSEKLKNLYDSGLFYTTVSSLIKDETINNPDECSKSILVLTEMLESFDGSGIPKENKYFLEEGISKCKSILIEKTI